MLATDENVMSPTPRASAVLDITPPATAGQPYVVFNPSTGRYLRMGADAVKILRALDGVSDLADVRDRCAPGLELTQLESIVAQFDGLGLLDAPAESDATGSSGPHDNTLLSSSSRLRINGLTSIQLTLADPDRFLGRFPRLLRAVTGPWAVIIAVACMAAGVVATVARTGTIREALSAPVPVAAILIAAAGFLVGGGLHEVAHGAVAKRHGCIVPRMGLMLFYFAPSFFCDVSDSWRLPRRGQRATIALAGIVVQLALAGVLFSTVAMFAPHLTPSVRSALVLCAVSNSALAVVNLLPFVKLDGYLLLMSVLDVPGLRAKSIADARASVSWALLGTTRAAPRLSRRVPAVAFGIASAVAGPLLVVAALSRTRQPLLSLGFVGAAGWLVLLAGLGLAIVRRMLRGLGRLAKSGAFSRPRALLSMTLLLVTAGGAASTVTVPVTVSAGYVTDGSTVTLLVAPALADDIAPGQRVVLQRPGLVLHPTVGSGTVASVGARIEAVDPSSPIRGLNGRGPFIAFRLEIDASGAVGRADAIDGTGSAVVTVDRASIATSLVRTHLAPAWSALVG